jgi:hypothetical protein
MRPSLLGRLAERTLGRLADALAPDAPPADLFHEEPQTRPAVVVPPVAEVVRPAVVTIGEPVQGPGDPSAIAIGAPSIQAKPAPVSPEELARKIKAKGKPGRRPVVEAAAPPVAPAAPALAPLEPTAALQALRVGIDRILADPELDARAELLKLLATDASKVALKALGKRHRAAKHVGCLVAGCGDPHRARGYCAAHYQQWKRKTLEVAS